MSTLDYWKETLSIAADDADFTLTPEQLQALAESAMSAHENYGMAFYSPPSSERSKTIPSGPDQAT